MTATPPRPVTAITQRRDLTGPPHDETRDALDTRLAAMVAAAGGVPAPVPSGLGAEGLAHWLDAIRPRALILSGGADPGRDAVRDMLEAALLDHAEAAPLPVLGLCRGMQVMARRAGGALAPVGGHVATRHRLSGTLDHEVNSFHAMTLDGCPPGYRVLATAPDGAIEAIAHETLPWEGWMWHPEREDRADPRDMARLREVLTCGH
ncbi:gamma-glutamyl-gamma-aminobutyrate hydrolase [Palleronia sediminis]|uniref:Gamma-glutamyl-gamma-aminobutyrate hydrolase n=1 Tax=Palleronia sediminis TaxID=2547833 RepID=A0A4R6A6P7_9RHOB|nr:gamma-glutamyl-gamma-aminobutyrate hydrolase family protein [Palleronia sediminis]TDL79401.1 gamma-glutamyl-gamma-aminobutyrate hydrolase [Palleronia sediminis]